MFFKIRIKKQYSFLWIKYVTAFQSNTHCMNCLVGGRSLKIPPASKAGAHPYLPGMEYFGILNEHPFKYVYLCGVTNEYANNLHVVVRYKPGSVVIHEDQHSIVEITNAERLDIPKIAEPIDRGHHYTTCRNFMFGYAYLRDSDPYDGVPMAQINAGKPGKSGGKRRTALPIVNRPTTFAKGVHRIRLVRPR
ncbi:hypothetical protein UFOVP1492_36 [uncultured Caudovirales phage]|uniref:Uncharacterized protein n=1 Tax=uncultured Caudovirales phage TaxID=2100421 RepID=A0A6J5QSS5_9CAUD|nr:hypothetical protein UFOVP1127_98 [uncultured Caudovirales phage]CAB4193604.1 hypothetical protein UFOVP1242_112 [uncultured Caudovirales phage]CAB4217494.1 hypothetical protein UFOVP1492_36 [uncultured Caudovirales phage]CAB5231356.1 hypothetical protein UFOVP1580_65 [uncultured Caudovirales phage]